MEKQGESSSTSVKTLNELGLPYVPQRFVLPPLQRPDPSFNHSANLPTVDLSAVQQPFLRTVAINGIQKACSQVINHGIPNSVMNDALEVATDFFNLPIKEKMLLILSASGSISGLQDEIEEGSQVVATNYYPACPQPELALGMPPHSDYGSLTILLQSCQGLQILDCNKSWIPVPVAEGVLIVQLGDQLEVMSNGLYKSVVHRVTLSPKENRLSIASLHSLPLNKKMGPAPALVDEQHPVT